MTHHPHTAHPNYDPRQIWFDGCAECHVRSLGLPMTMMELDSEQFREAWLRAFWWQHDDDTSLHLSETEMPLLKQLWAIQVMLERFYGWPVGIFPENPYRGEVGALGSAYLVKMRAPRDYNPEDQAKLAALLNDLDLPPQPGDLEGTHPNLDEPCRFEGCPRPAEETTAVTHIWLKHLHGSGDAGAVPLCHAHAEMIRQSTADGCDQNTCRFPFGGHAKTCALYLAYGGR